MRHDFLDKYSRLKSPVHNLPAGWKTVIFSFVILSVLIIPVQCVLFFVGIFLLLVVVLFVSRIPKIYFLKRLLFLEPFVFSVAFLSLFQQNGLSIFERIIVRSTCCIFAVILYSNTTQFSDVLNVLKKLKTPEIIVTTLALFYRYIFVLVDESERMTRGRKNRTFKSHRTFAWFLSATVISQLFLRTTERAERIYAAMCARGWK